MQAASERLVTGGLLRHKLLLSQRSLQHAVLLNSMGSDCDTMPRVTGPRPCFVLRVSQGLCTRPSQNILLVPNESAGSVKMVSEGMLAWLDLYPTCSPVLGIAKTVTWSSLEWSSMLG